MAEWIAQAANWGELIYKLMRKKLLSGDYIQVAKCRSGYHDHSAQKGQT